MTIRIEITDEMVERAARALHQAEIDEGHDAVADWDFEPAVYMRHVFTERARVALEAVFDTVEHRVYGVL